MSVADWATTISGVLAVLAAFGWVIKRYLVELKPNSGSSMNDRLTRVETKVDIIYDIVTRNEK